MVSYKGGCASANAVKLGSVAPVCATVAKQCATYARALFAFILSRIWELSGGLLSQYAPQSRNSALHTPHITFPISLMVRQWWQPLLGRH
jgi:hypothetical protein